MKRQMQFSYRDRYSQKGGLYDRLIKNMMNEYRPLKLGFEYSYFIQDNLLQFLIRLSRFKFASKMLKPSDKVLEIGCGSGLGTNFLAQFVKHVKAIDVKAGELQEARLVTRRKNITYQRVDFFDLPKNELFNGVVTLDVIEHLTGNEVVRFVKKTARHLKQGGFLILGTPSKYAAKYQSPLSKASHKKLYDQKELLNLMDGSYHRTIAFSMNDEIVHTGFSKLAWYYFVLAFVPKES